MASFSRDEQDQNLTRYQSKLIVNHYSPHKGLLPAEQVIIDRVMSQFTNRPILDLGVGTGRTTPHLLRMSPDYLGIDYSSEMIERCRQLYPGVRFELADARKLEAYSKNHYAFILFSNNGIDYVPHTDRLIIFRQIRHLLAQDGLFAFSTHNKLVHRVSPFNLNRFRTVNPLKFAWRIGLYATGIARYLRLRKYVYEGIDHAIRVDGYFNYSFATYYINASDQVRQLQDAGFDLLSLFNARGEEIPVNSCDDSQWLYYLVRKTV